MTIEEILNSGVVAAYNVAVAKEIGLEEVIILNTMKQLRRRQDGYISCETDILVDLTGLSATVVERCLRRLIELKYIETKVFFIGEDWVKHYLYKIK